MKSHARRCALFTFPLSLIIFLMAFLSQVHADPLAGTYSDGELTLSLKKNAQGTYSGSAILGGVEYPVTAQGTPQKLSGSYNAGGMQFPFQGALQGDVFTFATGLRLYQLNRQGEKTASASAGPLGGSPPPAAPKVPPEAAPAEPPPTPEPAPPTAAATATPESSSRFIRKEDGFSVGLAGGFFLMSNQNGVYLLGSKTTPGMVLVKPEHVLTPAKIEQGMRSGYQEEGLQLIPSGAAETLNPQGGSGKAVPVTGILDGAQVQGFLAGFTNPENQGMIVTALTTPQEWPKLKEHAQSMLRDVQMFAPETSQMVQRWDLKLRGKKMTYMSSFGDHTGGGSTKIVYALCSDGRFAHSNNDSMSFDIDAGFGHQHSSGQGQGQWTIRTQGGRPVLHFAFNDGSSRTFELKNQGTKTFLNDSRYFVTSNDVCQ